MSRKCIINKDIFINDAKKIHGDYYDYSLVKEITSKTQNVKVICPKHGDFWQKVSNHINLKQGCPSCKQSLLEKEVEQLLIENSIKYKYEYNTLWLGIQKIDFYLPDYRIAIECQGIQHFEPVDFGYNDTEKANEKFQHVLMLDEKKRQKCQENNVCLLYYANYKYDFPYNVITNKQELLTKILKQNDKN